MRAAGFVLVGGQSSRMGRDKALLPLQSRPLVDHLAYAVKAAAGNVTLVGHPERYRNLGWPAIADVEEGLGPIGGIATALRLRQSNLNLIVACDLTGLKPAWLSALLEHAEASGATSVVSRMRDGEIQPLCGVYRSECLPLIETMIVRRDLRIQNLVAGINAHILQAEETVANVNTPDEWSRWLSHDETTGLPARGL